MKCTGKTANSREIWAAHCQILAWICHLGCQIAVAVVLGAAAVNHGAVDLKSTGSEEDGPKNSHARAPPWNPT